ncbi:ankyrin repeat domain-containing protein [Candidatus Babeliales bacterium]|nr:ankyrin repeat domain-containing protein [Candidatus Babeliales bacterium]
MKKNIIAFLLLIPVLSPALYAAASDHTAIETCFNDFCANERVRNSRHGIQLIHYAASHGYHAAVRELIAEDADIVNISDLLNRTPLMHAALPGNLEMMQILLDAKANPKATSDFNDPRIIGGNALHHFIFGLNADIDYHNQEENLHIIQLLLDRGVEKHQVDMMGRTPYDLAEERNFSPYLRLLHDVEAAYQEHLEKYPHAQKSTARTLDFSDRTKINSDPIEDPIEDFSDNSQNDLSETFSISSDSDDDDDLPPLLPASPSSTSQHNTNKEKPASQMFSSQVPDGLSEKVYCSPKRQRTQSSQVFSSQPLAPDDEASQFFSQSAHDEREQSMPKESPFATRTGKRLSRSKDLMPIAIDLPTTKDHTDQRETCKTGQNSLSPIK